MTAQEEQRGQSLKSTPEASAGTPSSPKGAPARKPQGNDRVTRMGTASLPRLITEFAIPAILGMLVNAAYKLLDAFLTFSSATDEVRPYAATFIQILSFGFVLQMIGMGVNNFIRTAGAPNRALLTMVIGAVVCTIFNYILVLKLGWGVAGSAYATLIGQAASCISVLWFFIFTKDAPLKLHLHCMRPHAKIIRSILSLGLASFAVQAGAAVVNFAVNFLLVKYGSASAIGAEGALASIGVVQRIAMFTVMPLVGVSIAIQPLLGFNYGAKIIARVRKTLWLGVAFATSLAVIMWALVHLFPNQIVGLFGITNASLADFTIFALKVQLLMLPLVGFQIVGSNYFQATGQPMKSMILSLTRQVLFLLPLMFWLPEVLPGWFPQFTGLDALYIATPVADFLAIFTVGIFIAIEMRRLKDVESGKIISKY